MKYTSFFKLDPRQALVFKEDACSVARELVLTETFAAKCEGLIFLNKAILTLEKKLFHEFHDWSLLSGQPMASVLVSSHEVCRICCKTLTVNSKIQPIVIYSSYRGTYLGLRITKVCHKCKLYEHGLVMERSILQKKLFGWIFYCPANIQHLKWASFGSMPICWCLGQCHSALLPPRTTGSLDTVVEIAKSKGNNPK